MSGHAKMPPASHQVSATSLKLLIQQIHPHVRVERDSGPKRRKRVSEGVRCKPFIEVLVNIGKKVSTLMD